MLELDEQGFIITCLGCKPTETLFYSENSGITLWSMGIEGIEGLILRESDFIYFLLS